MGRPRGVSDKISCKYTSKKEYNNEYRKQYRYIFSVNLSQDKDSDIIEALESYGMNRQKALKDLVRAGIKAKKVDNKIICRNGKTDITIDPSLRPIV